MPSSSLSYRILQFFLLTLVLGLFNLWLHHVYSAIPVSKHTSGSHPPEDYHEASLPLAAAAVPSPATSTSSPAEPQLGRQRRPINYLPFGDSITEITCWRSLLWSKLQEYNASNSNSSVNRKPLAISAIDPPSATAIDSPSIAKSLPLPAINFVGSLTSESPLGCRNSSAYPRRHEGHSGFLAVEIAKEGWLKAWLEAAVAVNAGSGQGEGPEEGSQRGKKARESGVSEMVKGEKKVDVVTMHLGTNDIGRGYGKEEILDAYEVLVRQMREHNPDVEILIAQIIPMRRPSLTTVNRWRKLRDMVLGSPKVATEGGGLPGATFEDSSTTATSTTTKWAAAVSHSTRKLALRASNAAGRFLLAQPYLPTSFLPLHRPATDSLDDATRRLQHLNAAIPGWASARNTSASPIVVVDMYSNFDPSRDLRDGLHPSLAGDAKLAGRWFGPLVWAVGEVEREAERKGEREERVEMDEG